MAYLKALNSDCQTCGAHARYELVNQRNAPIGHYCRVCGQTALERQQRLEAERALRTEPTDWAR